MWSANAPRLFKYNSGSAYSSDPREAEDAHAHSPTRHEHRASVTASQADRALYNAWLYRNFPAPVNQWPSNPRESRGPREPFMPDPFIDPYVLDTSVRPPGARSSIEDVPMPDYAGSSSASSRAFSSMTGISYEHSKQPSLDGPPIDEAQYNQLAEALAASRAQGAGTQAPVNTPSATAPVGRRLSAAAEARSASYGGGGSRSSVLREMSQRGSRNVSESSAKSNLATDTTIEAASRKLQVSPSGVTGHVRGRKEGSENKENEGSVDTTPLREIRTPSKVVHTSGSVDNESRRSRSGSHLSKDAPVVITPTRGLQPAAADDPILQGSLEQIFDTRIQLGGAGEVAEIE
jgi:hypothetical protein